MKATEEVIDAGCKAVINVKRPEIEKIIQAALDADSFTSVAERLDFSPSKTKFQHHANGSVSGHGKSNI